MPPSRERRPPVNATGSASPTTVRKFVPRGLWIILTGLLLNVLVFPKEPVLSGGVLQMIGFAIIVMVPALWLLPRYRGARWALLAIAVGSYLGFVLAFPWLTRFVA